MAVVITEEMQVVAGHGDRAGIVRTPKTHQAAANILQLKFRLVAGGGH